MPYITCLYTPEARLIWDTGHQAYPHKMLTGRRHALHDSPVWGLAPFPKKREESNFDTFGVGYCRTSISAAMGMAIAHDLAGIPHQVVVIVGDGALTAIIAFEALTYLSECKANVFIVLTNKLSISPTVGGLAYTTTPFEKMGFYYEIPIDGRNLPSFIQNLRDLKKRIKGPTPISLLKKRGKDTYLLRKILSNIILLAEDFINLLMRIPSTNQQPPQKTRCSDFPSIW